ncbi:MAG TPA: sigma-70 family RNA polymerase sigma factor [Bacteroidales bacterium]|nr:sigma-70 family RNA polymerase sigma factor [Bacteroidales bacterium]
MEPLTTEIIIDGIRTQDKTILKAIYYTHFPSVKRLIEDNTGSEQDAKDIFQDALIIIYRKIKAGNLTIHTSFKAYIFAACRKLWLKELLARNENMENLAIFFEYQNTPDINIDEYTKHKQYQLYQKHFNRLGIECQKTLKLFFKEKPFKEIAKKLGTSYDYIRTKKSRCMNRLIRYIKEDPEYERWK